MTPLQSNFAALTTREPRIVERLFSSLSVDEELQLLETPSGIPTATYRGAFLHSRRDPAREAEKFVSRWDSPVPRILIMEGFGLGYQARAFLSAFPDLFIWVIEPDIRMHYSILTRVDLSDLLTHPRILFFYDPAPRDLGLLATETGHSSFGTARIRSVYEKDQELYEAVEAELRSVISRRQVNQNTLKRFGRLWIRNLFKNLSFLPEIKGLYHLKDAFRKTPALLIAAGPSLEKIMPHLPELKKRFLFVCVDTALPLLAEEGIEPDFVTVVDAQYWNTRHIDGQDLSRTILISESSVHPRVLRSRPRDIFFSASHFPLSRFLEEATDIEGRLSPGGSVATAAWEICRYMGCSEIYCAGLDLGFPGGQTHHRNSFFEKRSLYTGGRQSPLETSSFHALHDAAPSPVEDNQGGTVLTDQRMSVYIKWFENQIGRHPEVKTFNLSAGGVRITGMGPAVLEKLENYTPVRVKIEGVLNELAGGKVLKTKGNRKEFIQRAAALSTEFSRAEELAQKGLILTDRLEASLKEERPLDAILPLMDEVDREILDSSVKNMAGFLFQEVISRITESSERTAAENSRALYSEIKKASRFHLDLLADSLKKLG